MSTQDLLSQWMKLAQPNRSREELIKAYALSRDVFLERMSEFLMPEVAEQIKAMPDNTYFWPNSVGDFTAGSTEELATITTTFKYERLPK